MQKTLTTIIQLSKNKYIEKETGYLICENATLGSTGMQEYFAGDLGIEDLAPNVRVKVYRPAEEVFNPESLASLENKAFTVYHPDEMVNSNNDSRLRKGSVYNVHRVGDIIVGNIQVTDQDTIEKTKHIKCLSLGYNLDLDKMDDAENSYIARNIRYNHLALVPKGRSKVAQINDSDQEFMEEEYMSLFHKNIKVSDAEEEENKAEDVETTDVEETKNESETETAKDECSEEVAKDECTNETATDEEEKTEEVAKDTDTEETAKDSEEEVHDEEKEEEKVEVGDTDTIETTEKVEEKKEIKDGGEMTLEEIDKLTDADVRKIALEEYKAKAMADKGLVYGDENAGFKKPAEEPKPTAMDAEVERKLYYKNILNPHKNKNWQSECVNATDIDL